MWVCQGGRGRRKSQGTRVRVGVLSTILSISTSFASSSTAGCRATRITQVGTERLGSGPREGPGVSNEDLFSLEPHARSGPMLEIGSGGSSLPRERALVCDRGRRTHFGGFGTIHNGWGSANRLEAHTAGTGGATAIARSIRVVLNF